MRFQNKEKNLHYTIPTNRKTVFAKHSRTQSTVKKLTATKYAGETIKYIDYARERGYSMLQLLKYELTSTSQFLTTESKDGIKLKKNTLIKSHYPESLLINFHRKNGMYSVVLRWQ